MARPRTRTMAVPRNRAGKSATVAATLSFLLPGAGQAYARHWRHALVFGAPVLLGLALLLNEIGQGVSHFVARLLDPAVALTVLATTIVLAVWRIFAVLHAWRIARRTVLAWMVMPLLLVMIVGTHGFAFVSAAAMLNAGDRMASSGDSLLEPALTSPPIGPTPPAAGVVSSPAPPATAGPERPAQPSVAPPAGPTLDPAIDEDPYNDEDGYDDGEPRVDEGPPPSFNISHVDTQTDGLLNVLLVGLDWMPGRDSRRADTMLVVSVDTETGDVHMFSFPRDIAQFPLYDGGTFHGKLNSFARYAQTHPDRYHEGGLKSLSHQIGFLLGIPIDYYAAVDIPGFERVVKAVGGVTIHNERAIADRYMNRGEGFFLPAGEHRLNAADTVKYVRSRKGSSDFARARRQQQVLAALRREMARPEKLANLPEIMDSIGEVLRTDFPRDRITDLVALSERVGDDPTNNYVFKSPEFADFQPRSVTGGRSLLTLRINEVRALSLEIFGERSLYNR